MLKDEDRYVRYGAIDAIGRMSPEVQTEHAAAVAEYWEKTTD